MGSPRPETSRSTTPNDKFLSQAGVARFGEPQEIADLIAFAVSPAARWMTGTVLRMDGGEVKSV
ncbi:SDR family oxidoreductase [Bradyrhizobium sp. LTSP857]|uniref:SDR family oxidoreductase n=1 Tax=Bradyrhizobium sp. LTSP857 TaxID=1619231 RepID=UPI0032DF713E